ncbi:MAG: PAS domain S-box protein [Actinobacteria bacterium]|nr:MAG: PAS domain S-box protein [Actinomycetota bacterium]
MTDAHNLETTLSELRTLRDERRRYAELFDVAPDSLFVTDYDGRIVEANSAAVRMLEVPPRLVEGQMLAEFLPAQAQEAFAKALGALARGEPVVERDLPLRRGDGDDRIVQARVVTVGDGEVRWALRDVTEQRATEVELREANVRLETRVVERTVELDRQRALLQAVLEQNPLGIAIVDEAAEVVLANAEAKRILGIEAAPATAEGYRSDGTPYADDEWPVMRSLRAGDVVIGERARIVRPDGEKAVVEINSGPIRDADGRILAAVSVFRDVTVEEQRDQAEREFVSNAAHELRTPLAAIVGAVEVLQSGAKDDPVERERFLSHLERQCRRLERLTNALLTLARVQTRAEAPRLEIVELCPLFEEIAQSLHPAARVSVQVDCPEEIAVFANRPLIEEALLNLAANAVKYTLRGKVTLAATEPEPGFVEVEVRDTGRGMTAADRKRAFERFYRGDDDTEGGFGLGLAIVAAAAEAMGAPVEIDSAPRRGTTVRLRLRAAKVLAA